MYIDDHRWFSKHVPSVPSTFIINYVDYVPDPAAPAAPTAPGCAWRAGGDLPRAWDGLDHEGHLGRVLLRRQLRLGTGSPWVIDLYDFISDFICNMNLCCTIWLYLSLYDPITLLSLLYDFKWWYNVLHGRFNLETWNYLCIHTQSYFTDPQKRTLKWHGRGWRSHDFHRMKKNRLDPSRKAMVIAWVS